MIGFSFEDAGEAPVIPNKKNNAVTYRQRVAGKLLLRFFKANRSSIVIDCLLRPEFADSLQQAILSQSSLGGCNGR